MNRIVLSVGPGSPVQENPSSADNKNPVYRRLNPPARYKLEKRGDRGPA